MFLIILFILVRWNYDTLARKAIARRPATQRMMISLLSLLWSFFFFLLR